MRKANATSGLSVETAKCPCVVSPFTVPSPVGRSIAVFFRDGCISTKIPHTRLKSIHAKVPKVSFPYHKHYKKACDVVSIRESKENISQNFTFI